MQIKYQLNPPDQPPGLLRKLLAVVIAIAAIGAVLMFSAVLLIVLLIVGTLGGAYLWWKTRELRKQLRRFSRPEVVREAEASNDAVFEGEVIRVVDPD